MLEIALPKNYNPERRYICQVMFNEFLGIPVRFCEGVEPNWVVTGKDGKKLIISDVLFQSPLENWLKPNSLPERPIKRIDLKDTVFSSVTDYPDIPVLYSRINGTEFYEIKQNEISLAIDIFGSSFFMLTRYEEIVSSKLDEHGRFPSRETIAYQEGFLERPLVNEYLEILWVCIEKLWPDMERKERKFRVRISHDIDRSFMFHSMDYGLWIKYVAGDLIFRKSPALACQTIKNGVLRKLNRLKKDPFDTYDWLMDISEKNSIQSEFYFLCGGYGKRFGPNYKIDDEKITDLFQRIHSRGHKIGIHPSYQTYIYPKQLAHEVEALTQTLDKLGIALDEIGGRQHYYRWQNPTTWQLWEDSGLAYDSSLAFEEYVGFRCGTCYEFPVFNLHTSSALRLKERPLVINEDTLFNNDGYPDLSYEQKCEKGYALKKATRKYNGVFEVLWHNDGFYGNERSIEFYKNILQNQN